MTPYAHVSRSCTVSISVPIIRRTPPVPRRRGTLQRDVPPIFALRTLHAGVPSPSPSVCKSGVIDGPAVAAAGAAAGCLPQYISVQFGNPYILKFQKK